MLRKVAKSQKPATYCFGERSAPSTNEGGSEMSNESSVETAVCEQYQMLLAECQRALETWNEFRTEFCQFRFFRREAGDELLRLQANCIRAYSVLQNHERNCSLCQPTAGIKGRDSEFLSETLACYETCT